MSDDFIDFYELLGIQPTASPDEIKSARRKKLLEGHCDMSPDSAEALEFTKQMNAARSVLLDPVARQKYDAEWAWRRLFAAWKPTPEQPTAATPSTSAGASTPPPAWNWTPQTWTPPTPPPAWTWTPPASPPSAPESSTDGTGILAGLAVGVLLLGGIAFLAANTNKYDPAVERYRGRDGRFRPRRFF